MDVGNDAIKSAGDLHSGFITLHLTQPVEGLHSVSFLRCTKQTNASGTTEQTVVPSTPHLDKPLQQLNFRDPFSDICQLEGHNTHGAGTDPIAGHQLTYRPQRNFTQ
jgi:hypothetical protein